MDCLIQKNKIWPQINAILEEQDAIKPYLTLRCQNHLDQYTQVKEANDFLPVSEGGCTRICGQDLDCGHVCKSLCHIVDRDHTEYRCKDPCTKILCEIGHMCPKMCYNECGVCMVPMEVILTCGHKHMRPCHENPNDYSCPVLVNVELGCGHKANKPCHRDIATFPCPHPCDIRRECGHQCDKLCHVNKDPDHIQIKCFKPCGRYRKNCSTKTHECPQRCHEPCVPCEVDVSKERFCGHMNKVMCNEDVNQAICMKPCSKIMDCGHKCPQKCNEPCGNCKQLVEKTHDLCGHKIKVKCSEKPDRKKCKGKCPLLLSCGHRCQEKCNMECTQYCRAMVDCPIKPACGHVFKIPCHRKNITDPHSYEILKYCPEPCGVPLKCLHPCSGSCGKCAQGRIHLSCQQACGTTLICGHPCDIPCRETCRPCQKNCTYSCVHSKCGKKCGQPCVPCKERCERRCEHVRCTKQCGEMCDIDPCGLPCEKKLRCKHPCIGFCGEPCPPVCRVCDPDNEIFEMCFGNEEEPDARFIYLDECKHVIVSDAMDQWIQQSQEEINVKTCPKCKTTITKTLRYSNYIKTAYADIVIVKNKQFGSPKDNEELRKKLSSKLEQIFISTDLRTVQKKYALIRKVPETMLFSKIYFLKAFANRMEKDLQQVNKGKRQALDLHLLQMYTSQLEIMSIIINILKKCSKNNIAQEKCMTKANYLFEILFKQNNRITNQEIMDFQLELTRYEKFVQICNIETETNFPLVKKEENVMKLHTEIWNILNSIERYSDHNNDILERKIKALREVVNKSMIVTAEEKCMINKAMGMNPGHWFKCPNGHIYCIGDCGGAMQIAKCNECGAEIGGHNHALLNTNTLDRSMDGAQYPAWSQLANMQNYRM